jgi:hypothetical protein
MISLTQDIMKLFYDIIARQTVISVLSDIMPTVAEWSRRTYPAPLGAGGVGSIPRQLRRTKHAFFPPLAIEMKLDIIDI